MKHIFRIGLVATVAVAFASVALADPPNFDFYGYPVSPVPGPNLGDTFTYRSILTNNGVVPTPIPMDFTNQQHTLVINGTLSVTGVNQQKFTGTVDIYSQNISGGTSAVYSTPGTFTDGTNILHGSINGLLTRNDQSPTHKVGNYTGKINWTGGTRVGELVTPNNWPISGGWSRLVSGIPSGYAEAWDGLSEQPAPVAVQEMQWGAVKALYN